MINDYKKVSRARLFKYHLLQKFPGAPGRRYRRNLPKLIKQNLAIDAFEEACKETAGKVAIDLGANMGAISKRMAVYASKVYAFEPDPWTVKQLRSNASRINNIDVIEAAAGTAEGEFKLYRHREFAKKPHRTSQSASLLFDHSEVVGDNSTVTVKVVDFVQFLRDLPGEVGILKIDIEGAEIELLNALFESEVLTKVEYIFCETHEKQFPNQKDGFTALRKRAADIRKPIINLDWQ